MLDLDFFEQNGYVNLGRVFDGEELSRFTELYDQDRGEWGLFLASHSQSRPPDAELRTSDFLAGDRRSDPPPRGLIQPIETIFEGPSCLGEVCLRHMAPAGRQSGGDLAPGPAPFDGPALPVRLPADDALPDRRARGHALLFHFAGTLRRSGARHEGTARKSAARSHLHGPAGTVHPVQPVRAARRDGPDHPPRAQDRPDLLRAIATAPC